MAEKATAPETDQTPPSTPEKEEFKAEDAKPAEDTGAPKDGEDRLKVLEGQLQELQQGLTAKEAQHKAEVEQLRLQSQQEADRRVTQAVQTTRTQLAAEKREIEIAQLQAKIAEGDESAIGKLAQLANEPLQQARKAEEAETVRSQGETAGWIQGYATSMNRRLERIKPTDERRGEYMALWNTGKFEELEAEMTKDESAKVTGASEERLAELEKKIANLTKADTEASEEEAAQKKREESGADLGGGTPGSTDLNQARRDYADGKISTARAKELGIV